MRFRICVLGVLLLGVALAAGALAFGVLDGFSVQAIENVIRSWGAWGVFASIGLMVLHSFVPFPAEFLALANGMVYGAYWGTAVTWTGAMLGAFLAFCLARTLGRPFVGMVVTRKNWRLLDEWAATQGWQVVLISRFIPVIAFNLINYAAGLTRLSWWTFAWTTGIGILPLTALMVIMGDQVHRLTWDIWLLLVAGVLGIWLVLRRTFHPPRESKSRLAP